MKTRWGIMVKAVLVVTLVVLSYQLSEAANSKVGTTGAQFLKIGVGGRPIGMGSAYAGIADDVNAIYWNPGGIGQIKGTEFMAMHNMWFQSINHEYIGFAHNIEKIGTLGIGVTYLTVTDIEKRAGDTDAADGTFGATDMAVALAYGREVSKNIYAGISAKYLSQTLDDQSATGFAGDVGVLWKATDKMGLGLAVQNLGTEMKFINSGDPLPMNIKAGVGYKFIKGLTVGLDVNLPNDNDVSVATGVEYEIQMGDSFVLSPRAGYKTGTDLGSISGLGAGFGFRLNQLGLDFAYVPCGDLGNSYRVSLSGQF
ncbi:MAG: PorV/PorQ family protein [bacterium]